MYTIAESAYYSPVVCGSNDLGRETNQSDSLLTHAAQINHTTFHIKDSQKLKVIAETINSHKLTRILKLSVPITFRILVS